MDDGNPYHVGPNRNYYVGSSVTYNGVPAELRKSNHYMESSFTSDNRTGTVFIRISIPDLKVQKCLQFELDETVWHAKQRLLGTFAKDLKDALNFGLYSPPINGRAGKFLEEERLLRHYPLQGPIGFLEFKYKRRVYKMMNLNPRKLKQLHTKGNMRHLMDYVKNCNVEKVTKLANKGLDPNFLDPNTGETPLSQAVMLTKQKSRELIISLVGGGAHLDYRTRKGLTPLHQAVLAGSIDSVKTLLDLGVSPNLKDARGLTPLYHCVSHSCNPICMEMLLMEKAVIGAEDEQGWMEIHQACHNGLVKHLDYLLSYGAEKDVQNTNGNTALHMCAIENQESCARLLLFRGANKDLMNHSNQTAYEAAIIAQNHDIILMLEQHCIEDVVPIREMPRYSNRRSECSSDHSTLQSIYGMSRSRSDPRINAISIIDDKYMTTSMHNLAYLNNNHPDTPSGGYDTESPRSMSVSSASSGLAKSKHKPSMSLSGQEVKGASEYRLNNFRPSSLSHGSLLQSPLTQQPRIVPQRSHSMVHRTFDPTLLSPAGPYHNYHLHTDPSAVDHQYHRLNVPQETQPHHNSMYHHYATPHHVGVTRRPSIQGEFIRNHYTHHEGEYCADGHFGEAHSYRRPDRLSAGDGDATYNHTPSPSGASVSSVGGMMAASVTKICFNGVAESSTDEDANISSASSSRSSIPANLQHNRVNVPSSVGCRNTVSLAALPMHHNVRQRSPDAVLDLWTPGMLHICVESYEATNPTELTLIKGEIIEVTGVSDQGYCEGRNMNGEEGWFPSEYVQDIRFRRRAGSFGDTIKASRDNAFNRNTLATLLPSGSYAPRTVVLQRGPEGYGFVLRGAKSQTNATGQLDFCPTPEFPALQYLDSVDPRSRSDLAGLKSGDFLLEINGENVVRASHDRVVQLIRQAGDTLAMNVVTIPPQRKKEEQWVQDGSMTLPVRGVASKKHAPAPPQRSPQTSISLTKTQGKQIADGMAELAGTKKKSVKAPLPPVQLDKVLAENDGQVVLSQEQKTASIRSCHSAKRVSCIEFGNLENGGVHGSDKYMSPSEMRIKKYHQKKPTSNGSVNSMEKSQSTSDLFGKFSELVYATATPVPSVLIKHKRSASGSGDVVDKYDYHGGDSVSLRNASSYGGSMGNLKTATADRPIAPPPPPPGGGSKSSTVPKRQAPALPKNVEPVRPAKTELVTISTNKKIYATTTEIKSSQVSDTSDQSSFKPANPPRVDNEPKIKTKSTVNAQTHQRNASSASKKSDSSHDDGSEKHSVSFAEDRVNDNAQKFLQKHPNAQLLVTADVHMHKKKLSEPEPDYDIRGDEEEVKSWNSVTVISVGDKKAKSESSKQFTIKRSDIPASPIAKTQENVVIPPPPRESAPEPPTKSSAVTQPTREVDVVYTENVEENVEEKVEEEVEDLPIFAPPPPAPRLPPLPTPALPVQENSPSSKVGGRQTGDGPTTSLLPTGDIMAAVQKRRARMETEGPKLTSITQKKPVDTQAAILAAVAKRRQHLEQKSDTDVLNQIESRLHRTKKLQSAKLFFSSEGVAKKPDVKTPESPRSKPVPVASEKAKASTVVSPRVETKGTPKTETKVETKTEVVNRKSTASPQMKPLFDSKAVGKVTEESKVVTQKAVDVDKDEKKTSTTDFLAMAEKARQDWLQKKASSSSLTTSSPSRTTATTTTARAKSEPPKATVKETDSRRPLSTMPITTPTVKETDSVMHSSKPMSPTQITTSTVKETHSVMHSSKPMSPTQITTSTVKETDSVMHSSKPMSPTQITTSTVKETNSVPNSSKPMSPTRIMTSTVKDTGSVLNSSKPMSPTRITTSAVKETDSVQHSRKPMSPTPIAISVKTTQAADKPKVNGIVPKVSTSTPTPLKSKRDTDLISRTTSIRDRIANFEKPQRNNPGVSNGRVRSTSPNSPRYKVQGVTTDSTSTEPRKASTSALPPPPGFGDVIQVDIIPPPSGFQPKHEDTDSVVSSVSTLSTLSDDHTDSGYSLSKKNSYEDLMTPPPPPPGFDDNGDQGYGDLPSVIPPPPDFENNKSVVVKPVRTNKPFLSKPLDSWQCLDVLDWLDSLNMIQYKSSFQQHCIDGKKLTGLSRNDYIELGVAQVEHRMNLKYSIKKAAMQNSISS